MRKTKSIQNRSMCYLVDCFVCMILTELTFEPEKQNRLFCNAICVTSAIVIEMETKMFVVLQSGNIIERNASNCEWEELVVFWIDAMLSTWFDFVDVFAFVLVSTLVVSMTFVWLALCLRRRIAFVLPVGRRCVCITLDSSFSSFASFWLTKLRFFIILWSVGLFSCWLKKQVNELMTKSCWH